MDKREFYKELMSEYTFDKNKILANAKKGKMAGRKPLPIYIGMTAAAAVIITVSGVSIAMHMDGNTGAVLNPTDGSVLMDLSPEERVKKALEELRKNENSTEMHDVLVSFSSPLAPPQAQGVLASQSSVAVKMLFMEDDSKITDVKEIEAAFNGGTAKIRGAVINCPGYMMTQIDSSEFVDLVEMLSKEDLANMMAIEPVVTPPVPVNPDNNSKPDENNSGMGGENPIIPVVGVDDVPDTSDAGGNTSDGENSNSDNPTVPDNPDKPDNPNNPNNPNNQINPEQPTNTSKLPDGVTLPSSAAEKQSYITDDIGAERAYFLTEDVFFVKTKSTLRLYRWNGEVETLAAEQKAEDVKICWISENGGRLMVTGVENGVRNKMYIVDATNCTINDMKVENIVNGGKISGAAYNETLDVLAVNVNSEGSNDIYVANLSGYQTANETLVASGLSEGAALLAASNGAVYFSNLTVSANGAGTTIYKYAEGSVTEAQKLEGAYVAVTNSAFTHAIVMGAGGSFVFDPATEKMISVQSDKTISFGVAAHSLACNGGYFTVKGGQLVVDDSISTIAKIDFMRSFSTKYAAVVSNGSVRIIPAPYTSKILAQGVTFVQPSENASAEARAAVNSAIGLINAIADGKVAKSGIDTAQKFSQTIDACFTTAAASQLKTKCAIADGSVNYSSGSLSAINVADTVLAMQNNESGTLFVKAGTFDGRAAYTAISVKLAVENGTLKADCIIN
ncbi:MAG: hypothetical protein ACI4JS_09580 [Oscillospiraceae bacterium]